MLSAIRQRLPHEALLYFGDQVHVPYGPRSLTEIQSFAAEITRFLLGQGARLIVVACNTASAAALHALRDRYPDVPFVGMEPAVKPAAEITHTGKVGVLATPTTFAGDLYTSLVERFARDVTLLQSTCPGLVEEIEAGHLDTDGTGSILREALAPMLAEGIDTVVMGCTHYPFVIPQIEAITGPGVRIIDPAPAIARQVERLLNQFDLIHPGEGLGAITYITTGEAEPFRQLISQFGVGAGEVREAEWTKGVLHFRQR